MVEHGDDKRVEAPATVIKTKYLSMINTKKVNIYAHMVQLTSNLTIALCLLGILASFLRQLASFLRQLASWMRLHKRASRNSPTKVYITCQIAQVECLSK